MMGPDDPNYRATLQKRANENQRRDYAVKVAPLSTSDGHLAEINRAIDKRQRRAERRLKAASG